MVSKDYYCMLQGGGTAVLAEAVRLLPKAEVLWAGLGDAQIEPTRRLAPVHSGHCDLSLVVRAEEDVMQQALNGRSRLKFSYVIEVKPTTWNPSKDQLEQAEVMSPSHEPSGILKVLQQNWFKLINLQNAVRNVVRVRNIICFATYHLLWARDMWQPFDMINMMKFETEKGGGLYELYREETGKLVMAKGGKMGYFADIKLGDGHMDELMIVKYKTRWQFVQMAMLTPGYWPLALLRDEGLSDSLLEAVTPLIN